MENEFPEVVLIKHAIRDFEKKIRAEQEKIESTDYMFLEEEKPKDKARAVVISASATFLPVLRR